MKNNKNSKRYARHFFDSPIRIKWHALSNLHEQKLTAQKTKLTTGKILRNRNFLLILALVLGLAIGKPGGSLTQPTVIPLLAIVMVMATLNVSFRQFTSVKKVSRIVAYSLLFNYVILGSVTLLFARWLITDYELWTGFVVLALVPPAPAVVPFSYTLGGDVSFSLIGMIGSYLAALVIMPVGLLYVLGTSAFSPLDLLAVLVELIILPLIISRVLIYFGIVRYIEPYRGRIVNWSLFIIIFTIIALNSQTFLGDFEVLIPTGTIAVVTSFLLAYLLEAWGKALHAKHETTVSIILMGTHKNWSMAGGILLSLFSERSAIPPSVCVFFAIFMIVWLGYHLRKTTHEGTHINQKLIPRTRRQSTW